MRSIKLYSVITPLLLVSFLTILKPAFAAEAFHLKKPKDVSESVLNLLMSFKLLEQSYQRTDTFISVSGSEAPEPTESKRSTNNGFQHILIRRMQSVLEQLEKELELKPDKKLVVVFDLDESLVYKSELLDV
ncbi:MAG: hypothetical protein ACR2PX_13255 [Endozoicomonas sp.]|uniref:hypothetical protein n=1 Tax=Endozoicomonas sp. TaxID=1892382 RepID=UPI003D9AE2D1